MNLSVILLVPFVLLLNLIMIVNDCGKYYRVDKKRKAIGYTHNQDLIELCSDSTYMQTVDYLTKASKVVKVVKTETYIGKWHLNKDTLILTDSNLEYGQPIEHKYLIEKNKLVYIHQRGFWKGKVRGNKYKWKYFSGNKNLVVLP